MRKGRRPRPAARVTVRAALVAAALLPAVASLSSIDTARAAEGRLVYLALDGLGASEVEAWMADGILPHLAELRDRGGYARLYATPPASEEALWSTLAVGAGPGHHGLFDFTVPDFRTHRPLLADSDIEPPTFRLRIFRRSPPRAIRRRQGTPFWKLLDERGIAAEMLFVPITFPPDTLTVGRMISGLGTPDLRLTRSTFTVLTTRELASPRIDLPGGQIARLEDGGEWLAGEIEGPPDPRPNSPPRIKGKVAIRPGPDGMTADIELSGIRRTLRPGEWGNLLPITFAFSPFTKVTGWVRPHLVATSPLTITFSAVNIDPDRPYLPISWPPEFAAELMNAIGPFATVGWVEDTFALNAGVIPDQAFLDSVHQTLATRAALVEREIMRPDWRFLAAAFLAGDRVAHTFRRTLEPGAMPRQSELREIARRLDDLVGRIHDALDPDDCLVVFSTHGMASYARGFNLNTWLAEEGYLVLAEESADPWNAPAGTAGNGDIDWPRTRAYGLGNGLVYVNRAGRESEGRVDEEARGPLLDEISSGLEGLVDEATGRRPIIDILRGDAIFDGPLAPAGPDLVLIYRDGYSTSWASLLGGRPPGLFAGNPTRWTGEHASADPRRVAGFVIAGRPLAAGEATVADLAATALAHFGIEPEPPIAGRPILGPVTGGAR